MGVAAPGQSPPASARARPMSCGGRRDRGVPRGCRQEGRRVGTSRPAAGGKAGRRGGGGAKAGEGGARAGNWGKGRAGAGRRPGIPVRAGVWRGAARGRGSPSPFPPPRCVRGGTQAALPRPPPPPALGAGSGFWGKHPSSKKSSRGNIGFTKKPASSCPQRRPLATPALAQAGPGRVPCCGLK